MNTAAYNERVRLAAMGQRLRGSFHAGGGRIRHRWTVEVEKASVKETTDFDFGINPLSGQAFFSSWVFAKPGKSAVDRLWKVTVGPGSVNDEPACIEYLAGADPRGWIMPAGYAPFVAATKVFGPGYKFVDRPLTDGVGGEDGTGGPPFLWLTAPNADGSDLGGFVKTLDKRRPEFFRTAEAWEKELYQASVVVTLSPFKADPGSLNLQLGGARARRWRVTAGKLPTSVADAGVAKIASCEIARVWLLRVPGKPELDEVSVQQEASVGVCWNLWARSSVDLPFIELLGLAADAIVGLDLGLLAMGLTGVTIGAVLVGIEEGVVAIILANLEAIIAATSSVQFWSV